MARATSAEKHLDARLQAVEPGTFRHTVLSAARRFKSTWVELGKLLVQVRDEALYEAWGYPGFEQYCLAELRIKKATVAKLTRSYSFLDRHEPAAVRQPSEERQPPPFEVVEVLAQAEERGQLSAEDYRSVRDAIWGEDRPVSALKRELSERFPAPPPTLSEEARGEKVVALARRLAEALSTEKKVPAELAERAWSLADAVAAALKRG